MAVFGRRDHIHRPQVRPASLFIQMIALLFAIVFLAPAADARTLNLYTFHSPPYQVNPSGSRDTGLAPFGTTVETVRCVARLMEWDADIRTVPQNRAIHSLRNHTIDGYFAVDESDLLNRYAVPTAPVALEKWYFYSLKHIEDYTKARIAAIAGSNEAIWLEQSRYTATMTVSYPEQLLALLERDRVDAVLMDQRVMSLHQSESQNPSLIQSHFVRFAPLSLYVTLPFATTNPTFLNEFNSHIADCMIGGFELTEEELSAVAVRARALLNDLVAVYDLPDYLARQPAPAPLSDILELDRQWQELAPARASEKAADLLRLRLSGKMAQWQYEQGGIVTEILLMDRLGANVAISVLTSDYWQGDERKFEAILGRETDMLYLGPVRFDPSAQEFQIMASMPLHDPATGEFIGGLAVGLNIEKALRSQYIAPRASP